MRRILIHKNRIYFSRSIQALNTTSKNLRAKGTAVFFPRCPPIAAIIATLILSAIPILIAGGNLRKSYFYLFHGALGTRYNLLKTKLKVDDVVSTLLLNHVMIHLMGALLFGPPQQPDSSWPRSVAIVENLSFVFRFRVKDFL